MGGIGPNDRAADGDQAAVVAHLQRAQADARLAAEQAQPHASQTPVDRQRGRLIRSRCRNDELVQNALDAVQRLLWALVQIGAELRPGLQQGGIFEQRAHRQRADVRLADGGHIEEAVVAGQVTVDERLHRSQFGVQGGADGVRLVRKVLQPDEGVQLGAGERRWLGGRGRAVGQSEGGSFDARR